MNAATRLGRLSASEAEEEGYSLPAWIYHDPEFFEKEKAAIFRKSWQVVCHVNDVPRPGDFHSLGLGDARGLRGSQLPEGYR